MAPLDGAHPPPSALSDELEESASVSTSASTSLISSLGPPLSRHVISKFVKKLNDIPKIVLPPTLPCRAALSLYKSGLGWKFTSLWPSPKSV